MDDEQYFENMNDENYSDFKEWNVKLFLRCYPFAFFPSPTPIVCRFQIMFNLLSKQS